VAVLPAGPGRLSALALGVIVVLAPGVPGRLTALEPGTTVVVPPGPGRLSALEFDGVLWTVAPFGPGRTKPADGCTGGAPPAAGVMVAVEPTPGGALGGVFTGAPDPGRTVTAVFGGGAAAPPVAPMVRTAGEIVEVVVVEGVAPCFELGKTEVALGAAFADEELAPGVDAGETVGGVFGGVVAVPPAPIERTGADDARPGTDAEFVPGAMVGAELPAVAVCAGATTAELAPELLTVAGGLAVTGFGAALATFGACAGVAVAELGAALLPLPCVGITAAAAVGAVLLLAGCAGVAAVVIGVALSAFAFCAGAVVPAAPLDAVLPFAVCAGVTTPELDAVLSGRPPRPLVFIVLLG